VFLGSPFRDHRLDSQPTQQTAQRFVVEGIVGHDHRGLRLGRLTLPATSGMSITSGHLWAVVSNAER
jgi:hypothetical protein